jgi:hypothetical protein
MGKPWDELILEMKRDTIILNKGDNSFIAKEKEEECHKTRSTIKALHRSRWTYCHHATWRQGPSWRNSSYSSSCTLLSTTNHRESKEINKRRACNFLHPHFLDWKADAWGRPTPQDEPIKLLLLSCSHRSTCWFAISQFTLLYFYKLELFHNANIWESNIR